MCLRGQRNMLGSVHWQPVGGVFRIFSTRKIEHPLKHNRKNRASPLNPIKKRSTPGYQCTLPNMYRWPRRHINLYVSISYAAFRIFLLYFYMMAPARTRPLPWEVNWDSNWHFSFSRPWSQLFLSKIGVVKRKSLESQQYAIFGDHLINMCKYITLVKTLQW